MKIVPHLPPPIDGGVHPKDIAGPLKLDLSATIANTGVARIVEPAKKNPEVHDVVGKILQSKRIDPVNGNVIEVMLRASFRWVATGIVGGPVFTTQQIVLPYKTMELKKVFSVMWNRANSNLNQFLACSVQIQSANQADLVNAGGVTNPATVWNGGGTPVGIASFLPLGIRFNVAGMGAQGSAQNNSESTVMETMPYRFSQDGFVMVVETTNNYGFVALDQVDFFCDMLFSVIDK